MVSSWRRAPPFCPSSHLNCVKGIVVVVVGSSFKYPCLSLQWPAGHKSVDTADTHGVIMWQFGHPVGEMLQAVQVLTKNDKIWTPSEQTLRECMTAEEYSWEEIWYSSLRNIWYCMRYELCAGELGKIWNWLKMTQDLSLEMYLCDRPDLSHESSKVGLSCLLSK